LALDLPVMAPAMGIGLELPFHHPLYPSTFAVACPLPGYRTKFIFFGSAAHVSY